MLMLQGLLAVALIASVLIQRRNQAKFSENDGIFQQQDNRLAELAAENQRLSNLVVQTKSKSATAEDRTGELAQLRTKVGALQQQTNQLAKQVAENRRLAGVQFFSHADFDLLEHNK